MAFCLEEWKIKYDTNAFFTSNRYCIEYLLSVNLSPLEEYALLISEGNTWVFTPDEISGVPVRQVIYKGYSNSRYQNKISNILDKLDEFDLPVFVDTAYERMVYSDYFCKRGCHVKDTGAEVEKASYVKTIKQIEAVKFCAAMNEKAYSSLMGISVQEETELTLFRHITESVRGITGYPNEMIYDFLTGRRTGNVSGAPLTNKINNKDTLIADLLPRHNGVYADMTRTYFIGKPTDKQVYIYHILCEALEKTEELLKPGTVSGDIYKCMYNIFARYGMNENFPHHAGHGLGMGYFEAPYFLKEEVQQLEKNMIVALEPGLYFENQFGIRIENNYLITENGTKRMGSLALTMEDYILPFAG